MEPTDLAYFAGFFDGEGCVGIQKLYQRGREKPPTHTAYATISQIRPAVLQEIKDAFGGNLRFVAKSGANGVWAWQSKGAIAREFIAAIRPYCRIKAAEIDLVLEAFQERVSDRRAGVPLELRAFRESKRLEVMAARSV